MGSDLVLLKLDSARIALREAKTIPEAKRFVDIGVTAETWARQQKLGEEITSYAHAFTVDALAHLGRMLRETERNRGARGIGPIAVPKKNHNPTLADLGLDKKTSSLAQKIAKLNPEQLQAVRNANTSIAASLRADGSVRTQTSGEDEWYTPGKYIALARKVLGHIDLDPASNKFAQKVVKAGQYFTAEEDGLTKEWRGAVWLNPPYSRGLMDKFVGKLRKEIDACRTTSAILLTHNFTDTAWFRTAWEGATAVCFTHGRIRFYNERGQGDSPTSGHVFLYFGGAVKRFLDGFRVVGNITTIRRD